MVILLAPSPAPKVQLFGLFFRFSRSYGCSPLFVQHERKSAAVRFYSLYMRLEFLSFSKRFFVFYKEESSHLDGRNRRKKLIVAQMPNALLTPEKESKIERTDPTSLVKSLTRRSRYIWKLVCDLLTKENH